MAFHAADTHRATSEGAACKGQLKERCGLDYMCSERFTGSGSAQMELKIKNRRKWYFICPETKVFHKLLRWSRGSMLVFGTQVRGFKPGRSRRIFQGEKILSTLSFGGEVKLSVPSRRFAACKRFLNATWKLGISGKIHRPFLAHIVPPLATRISGETTIGESWNV